MYKRALTRRFIVVALAAAAALGMVSLDAKQSTPASSTNATATVSSTDGAVQGVRLVASERVTPKVTSHWWGYGLHFTKLQTRAVTQGAAIVAVFVPGGQVVAGLLQGAAFVAQEATNKGMCLYGSASWVRPADLHFGYERCVV